MRLSSFLESHAEEILRETVVFARSLIPLRDCDESTLRDHFAEVLDAVASDLAHPQSRTQSIEKGLGRGPVLPEITAAQSHGIARASSGLSIDQLFSEYRALRSCILRLWMDQYPPQPGIEDDLVRFSEAIDQAVHESVVAYDREVEHWRQVFLGTLSHDLRNPLNAVTITAALIHAGAKGPLAHQAVILTKSASRMTSMLDSLLEMNRAGLGMGMLLHITRHDVAAQCRAELELLQAAHPLTPLHLTAQGDTWGSFDSSRIREAFANLVTNAIRYSTRGEPRIHVEGDAQGVRISVHNAGFIAASDLEAIFEPLKRGKVSHQHSTRANLGLGLFIVRQIARAHGGEVTLQSDADEVCFTISLPNSSK